MMKKYISLVCGAVLLAALAVGCSGSFGFDGKDGGPFADDSNKDNPFKGTTWEDSEDGLTLAFESDTCEITTGTSKSAGIAREAASGTVSYGNYTYTWIANSNGSFTATLKDTSGGMYATFTIDTSGAVRGTLTVGGVPYTFEKKTGTGSGSGEDDGGGGTTGGEEPGTDEADRFEIKDGVLVKYNRVGSETAVTIPDTVRRIKGEAFALCRFLTSVSIPATVESIGLDAFRGCSSAKVYYDGTQEEWNHILFGTSNVTDTKTGTGLDGKTITGKDNTSWKFDNLDSLVWRSWVNTRIYEYTKSEEIVKIPFGATRIDRVSQDKQMFNGKTAIKQVIMPDTVIEILSEAFSGCTGLESISISNSMTSIVNKMFYGCTSLTSITIPDSVTKIESQAFMGCTSLVSVSLPEGLTSIGLMAFRNCTNLTSITIPDTVTEMGWETFWGCESLERVSIPASMTTIVQSAFRECKSLASVNIPDGVTTISYYAFEKCSELKDVRIPSTVTDIAPRAFAMCDKLTTVKYDGTKKQWEDISKQSDYGLKGKTIICTDGELTAE